MQVDPWVGKMPWKRKWQLTPVVLPRKSHGQRSLVGYRPWGLKELDMTEQLSLTHSLQDGERTRFVILSQPVWYFVMQL